MNMMITLPDVAAGQTGLNSLPLRWVGMEAIALPILVDGDGNQPIHITARADVFVSLEKTEAKGIHMSRLYLRLNQQLSKQRLSGSGISALLKDMVQSQQGLSQAAKLNLQFDLPLVKNALLSNESGYQNYTVTLTRELKSGSLITDLSVTIPYSSTCPCSAALSRQALSEAFARRFNTAQLDKDELIQWLASEQASIAPPHSQRSYAYIRLRLTDEDLPNLPSLIFHLEQVIGTSVQTAVKRQDEQAFAKLNAQNLLFCEDAARRIKQALELMPQVSDYWFKVEHQESLHAHNAVVHDQKHHTDWLHNGHNRAY